jgi:hypothetical protein
MADLIAWDEEPEAAEPAQKPVNGKHSANGSSKAARNGAHESENGHALNGAHESALNGASDIESALNGASDVKKEVAPELAPLFAEFNALGQDLYGEQWEKVCSRNVARISGGKAKYSAELTGEQMQQLITGMMKVKSNRVPVAVN